jgi:hypothetical protein
LRIEGKSGCQSFQAGRQPGSLEAGCQCMQNVNPLLQIVIHSQHLLCLWITLRYASHKHGYDGIKDFSEYFKNTIDFSPFLVLVARSPVA